MKSIIINIVIVLLLSGEILSQQQVSVPRIDEMPNQPQPYLMRNWKQVALGYDSLVFNFNLTGQYLPLIWNIDNTVNFPEHKSFGLATVVGPTYSYSSEAINVLPAVIGASLVKVDKSDQNGNNWVLMCEEYFNNRPEENIYLNHPTAASGDDWWYETMPNVFFYQLYDLYPSTGHFDYQFTTIADQWLKAVDYMGASITPWTVPSMNYRAWSFSQMKPLKSGVPEPEAAGAIAWILYNAYISTMNKDYLVGAEWAMEFLNQRWDNPAYELQLPYGVYTAARMNAQIGTQYDVEKMLNWCFDKSPLRNWGAVVGTWGGYDVHGLIGELYYNNYAFMMNGYEQVGALVPFVRYDERFARAIGKWVLNVANASRLFYSNYLSLNKQDSDEWSTVYDPYSYIGHEALREEKFGLQPYATGDAIDGGWGKTNLALYASSHVGILGGIIDTTNVPMVLKLDALKTDYFNNGAYPTFLIYNPFSKETTIELKILADLGMIDIYEAVSNQFLLTNVSGTVSVTLPADNAVLIVYTPAGGSIEYQLDKMLINNIVVDYNSGTYSGNYPPRIKSVAVYPETAAVSQNVKFYCSAQDRDQDELDIQWYFDDGQLLESGEIIEWHSDKAGEFIVECIVSDNKGAADTAIVQLLVVDNHSPQIQYINADPEIANKNQTVELFCKASDIDNDSLNYVWESEYGSIEGNGPRIHWTAPDVNGYYVIYCSVSDTTGATISDSIAIVVGDLVADYPFSDGAIDFSGFNNHGTDVNSQQVIDHNGNPGDALFFDGTTAHISVPNHPTLNCSRAISINFWLKKQGDVNGEEYLISHGSWQNRYKVSLLAEKKVRWTINTSTGISDLDSEISVPDDQWINVCVIYGNNEMDIYINGELNSSKVWNGLLSQTSFDLLIAKMLPGEQQYMYKGILDDIKIFNRRLDDNEILQLYDPTTLIKSGNDNKDVSEIMKPYPNPFNQSVMIPFAITYKQIVDMKIFNINGQCVRAFSPKVFSAGKHTLIWDGIDNYGNALSTGLYFVFINFDQKNKYEKLLLIK